MTRNVAIIALVAAGLVGVLAAETTTGDPVSELLSGGDFVPVRATLDQAAGADAEDDLLALASDQSGNTDTGIRLRAIRALALYPGPEAVTTLEGVLDEHASAAGIGTIYLRAAMSSLATVAGPDAVERIGAFLAHDSRDVRAAAARALATTATPAAIPLLRDRLGEEPEIQVRLALSAAIRELTGAPLPGQ